MLTISLPNIFTISPGAIAAAIEKEIREALATTRQLITERDVVAERAHAAIDARLPPARARTVRC